MINYNFELIKYFKENNVVIVMATIIINNTNIKIEDLLDVIKRSLVFYMLLKVF